MRRTNNSRQLPTTPRLELNHPAFISCPIFATAFSYLCQFNALNIMASLHEPSRGRMKAVIYKSIAASTMIYVMFGYAGFIWGISRYGQVSENWLTSQLRV